MLCCWAVSVIEVLFLHSDEFAGGSIDRNSQLCSFTACAIDDVPHQLVGVVVPVANINDGCVWRLFQDLVAAVLLCGSERLIGIDLEELNIPRLRRCIGGAVAVLDSGIDAARRSSIGRTA